MAKRPVFYPELGKYFRQLREARAIGQRQAASFVTRRGLADFSSSAITWLESGRTKNPSPDLLRALSKLYDVPYEEMVAKVVQYAYGLAAARVADGRFIIGGDEEVEAEDFVAVPLMRDRIAAGPPLVIQDLAVKGYLAFPRDWLEHHHVMRPLCLAVGSSERSMMPTINPGDTLLLDCADGRRTEPKNDKIYAVNVDGGSTVKRIGVTAGGLTIIADNPDKDSYATRALPMEESQTLFDVIVGQVIWKSEAV